MDASVLLNNQMVVNIDKGRYVETDVMGWKAIIYVPSGIDMSRFRKPLIMLILLFVKAAIWSLS